MSMSLLWPGLGAIQKELEVIISIPKLEQELELKDLEKKRILIGIERFCIELELKDFELN